MHRKLLFKILCSSDSVVAQKKFIFIFVRIIISLEKNSRKPVSILREEIGDFKLLKHIKLLVTDSRQKERAMEAVGDNSVPIRD